jgi:predicted transcriptional regulator
MTGRRGSVDIIFDILNEISKLENQKNKAERKPIKIGKTAVMYLGNLSYSQANEYYSLCLDQELLQLKENGNLSVTPKGYDLMNHYKSMRELFNGDTSQLSLSRIDTQTVTIKKH